jgi:Skp family chaperone for outer membrane proteins
VKTALVLGLLTIFPTSVARTQPAPGAAGTNIPQKTITLSLQRIATEAAEARAANQRLQALAKKMAADLTAKQKELAQPTGPEFQRLAKQSQTEFANTQRQVQADLRAKVSPIIAAIAAERGADIVLNADTLVWAAPRLDVTAEVISKLDAATASPR